MPLRNIDTLVIDLDNTIFDWFALWHASFKPIYDEIILQSNKSVKQVETDIRRVHQQHRTSEFSFLIEELQVLNNIDKNGSSRREQFSKAIDISRSQRDKEMKLYDTIYKSLWDIKKKGTRIIAYTESLSFYSSYRLKRFGLDGLINVLYSPEDHVTPKGTSLDQLRSLPDEFYELQITESRHTPMGELKPNPKILLDIIKSSGSRVENTAYVGDSLFKDVAMARDVGVLDIYAKYGVSQSRPEYELLQRVSHWTREDVEREKEITKTAHKFEPTVVLADHFSEIFMYCNFIPFSPTTDISDRIVRDHALDTWKKAIDVQQHFNDMAMRLRNFAITLVGAIITAIGFTYQAGLKTTLFGYSFSTSLMLIFAALCAWLAFYFIDRFGYHVLLKGAVIHAAKIEEEFSKQIPGIGLGTTISEASQKVTFLGFKTDSNRRLNLFYFFGMLMLLILAVGFIYVDENPLEEPKTVEQSEISASK